MSGIYVLLYVVAGEGEVSFAVWRLETRLIIEKTQAAATALRCVVVDDPPLNRPTRRAM